ncbi:Ku protein [Paraburkholderia sp. J8-2]|uniref:non-homologous end joining protein Ku n=1 Tax=Paraburkholderia sp. J8-2 TaxID=2805440 RepID=UPI002AB76CCD|nr:Ku protein [Paraburkholderia sp. J8-2]
MRSIASLALSFGLVQIPVKLYSATETSSDVKFNLLAPDGSRVEQQYVSKSTGERVERADMVKGYEFSQGQFVTFDRDELKAIEESPSHLVEILGFVPDKSVDPIFYDKAYFVAPDKRGAKPYSLLQDALRETQHCALARWNSKGKTHIVQIRAVEDGLVFQQLLWADEVRSLGDLHIEHVAVTQAELDLAKKIIEQGELDTYDPKQYVDTEKRRVLAAIDAKVAGKQIVAPPEETVAAGGEVIDLMEALRASLTRGKAKDPGSTQDAPLTNAAEVAPIPVKPKRSVKRAEAAPDAAPAKRARR